MKHYPLLAVRPVPTDLLPDTSDITQAGIIGDWLIFIDTDGDLCKRPAPGTERQSALLEDLLRHVREPLAA